MLTFNAHPLKPFDWDRARLFEGEAKLAFQTSFGDSYPGYLKDLQVLPARIASAEMEKEYGLSYDVKSA